MTRRNGYTTILLYLRRFWKPLSIAVVSLGLVNLVEATLPYIMMRALDVLQFGGDAHLLGTLALAYLGCAILQMFCRTGWRLTTSYTATTVGHELRTKISTHALRLSQPALSKHTVGEISSLAMNDVDAVRAVYDSGTIVFCDAIFNLLFYPVAMYAISPPLTLIGMLPLVLIPFLVLRVQSLIGSRFSKVQQSVSDLSAVVYQDLLGIRIIKSFTREDAFLKRFTALSSDFASKTVRNAKIESFLSPGIEFVATVGVVLCLGYAIPHVIGGAISIGTLVAFQQYIRKLMWPLQAAGLGGSLLKKASASAARIEAFLDDSTENLESGTTFIPGTINFSKVSFSYPGSAGAALSDISVTITPGERVAVLGETGSGKSTFFSLLLRIMPPRDGNISVNGTPLDNFNLQSLRKQIHYAPQDPFLFADSIAQNITGGRTNVDDNLTSVSETAALSAQQLPLRVGLTTNVGEFGRSISGGQRQRVALARALYGHPSILLLDDPFSALDTRTAAHVVGNLSSLARHTTILFTTQRLAPISLATRILVFKGGRIVQDGTHEQLVQETGGWYAKFVEHGRLQEALDAA